jgi:integrase/recombinase XerC/integrase/recombinase XerD
MKKRPALYKKARPLSYASTSATADPKSSLSRPELLRLFGVWSRDCQIAQHSPRTLKECRRVFDKLVWFRDRENEPVCGTEQMRAFFAYLTTAHENAEGRWGVDPAIHPATGKPLKPLTVQSYFGRLRAFFNWLVDQHELDESPLAVIKLPTNRPDQIKPFTMEEIEALRAAARHGVHAKRDESIILLLLDTGLRASDLCSLSIADIDTTVKSVTVEGKGGKRRTVYFGKETANLIWKYRSEPRKSGAPLSSPLFTSDRGSSYGEALTDSGLRQLVERLGKAAGISGTRCSPHTFRHTAAVWLLINGANAFTLKEILGHTTLTMTNKYVHFAQADIERVHRTCSPVDNMRNGRANGR